MNMCFSRAVVEVLLYRKHGLASWWIHPLKLTIKHILPYKYVVVVKIRDSTMIRT